MSGAIEFACPYCERVTRVPSTFAGKQGKCPGCQRVIEVPNPAEEQDAIPTIPTPAPGFGAGVANTSVSSKVPAGGGLADDMGAVGGAVAGGGGAAGGRVPDWQRQNLKAGLMADSDDGGAAGSDGATRPCPFCGEQIKAVAKKCKFCGEFLDKRLRGARGAGGPVMQGVLASRATRFAARFVDGLLDAPAGMIGVFGYIMVAEGRGKEPVGFMIMIVAFLLFAALSGYQWYLISTRGQSLAKGWFGIKIVKIDGTPVDFVSGVILRNWVYNLIGFIPGGIGGCVQLVGYLPIFAEDQRCLHDHIAGTRVVEA